MEQPLPLRITDDAVRATCKPCNVVFLVHGHPDYSAGGGEMAAYSLFSATSANNPAGTHLIAWADPGRIPSHLPGEITRLRHNSNEWLYHAPHSEWLYQFTPDRAKAARLVAFIVSLDPDVVHLQHYLGFGIEIIRLIRKALPAVKIVFTLHEFGAICLNDGQMVTKSGQLCTSSSSVKCAECFPHLNRSHFALREAWYKRHFALVDHFISPSLFLKRRFVDWGLDEAKISVVENAQICVGLDRPSHNVGAGELYATFGFFGQINPYKGGRVIAQAAVLLKKALRKRDYDGPPPRILIYGTMGKQSSEFQLEMKEAFEESKGLLEYRGSYDRHEVLDLMASCGWVLMPSTWWENSPVVIEEAFYAGRPIICSDIGGMREKVSPGINGLHFRARDPVDQARVLMECLTGGNVLWDQLRQGVRSIPTLTDSARQHYELYQSIGAAA